MEEKELVAEKLVREIEGKLAVLGANVFDEFFRVGDLYRYVKFGLQSDTRLNLF